MTETLCTAAMVAFMAGQNAPTITAGEATELINRAEGFIASETRYDWVAAYSGLGANTKKILEECCAAWAAISHAKHDPGNYNDIEEVNFICNVNFTKYKECMRLLKDKVVTDWLKQQTT
jgi:hypothetical protein